MSSNRFHVFPTSIVIYRGSSCLICDREGAIGAGEQGFYFRGTRFLSRLDLEVDGRSPRFVSANAVAAHSMIAYFLAPSPAGAKAGPEAVGEGGEIVQKAIELQVSRFVDGGLHQSIRLTNHGLVAAHIVLSLAFQGDFADQAEVKQGRRQQTAPIESCWALEGDRAELSLRYAHPKLRFGLLVRVSGAGQRRLRNEALDIALDLPPQGDAIVLIDICPRVDDELVDALCTGFDHDPSNARSPRASTRLTTSAAIAQRAWQRAVEDIGSLALRRGAGEEYHALAAGIPAYQGLFGRDVLIAGAQALLVSPVMLRGALSLMAKWQGRRDRPSRDEEPGKMLHQRQESPLALLELNPFLAYYGDYTAPAMFLIGVALDFAATADRAFLAAMRPHVLAVLDWMERYGDRDGDGFYEYDTRAEGGLKNQGWRDSGEAVLHPDGRVVENPIAMAEIQAAYYAAKQLTGFLFLMTGEKARGASLLAEAARLKERFNARFWLPEHRYLAIALGPDKKPVATIAPDAGQCLAYGILDADKSAAAVERLMRPDLFSGWGLRTLSCDHPAYNPFGYHLGDVWPWANALVGFGLRRFGFEREFDQLARAIFDATRRFALDRLPEAIGGHPRDRDHPHPGIYPESTSPQAWSASTIPFLLQTMLGIVPLAPFRALLIDPALPDWIPELTVSHLQVGAASVTLHFRRDAAGWTEHEVRDAPEGLLVSRPDRGGKRGEDKLERQIRVILNERGPMAAAS